MKKVIIIGAGFVSNLHADGYKNIKSSNVVGVVDNAQEAGRSFAEKYECNYYKSFEEAFSDTDFDIVDVCIPTFLHEEIVTKALENKKHVLCEKPLALTLESAKNMTRLAEKNGVKIMVAQVVRFWSEYVKIKELLDTKVLGEVKLVYACRLAQHPKNKWFYYPEKSGGGLFDLHLHDIDFLEYMFGGVESAYAHGAQNEYGAWDYVCTSLRFENGVSATAEGIFGMSDGYPFTAMLRVVGTEATVEYTFIAGFNLDDIAPSQNKLMLYKNGQSPQILEVSSYDPYRAEIEYFIECIENDKPIEKMSAQSAESVIKTILCVKKSLETKEVVFKNKNL